jgi:hypothetical protein
MEQPEAQPVPEVAKTVVVAVTAWAALREAATSNEVSPMTANR